MNAEQQIIASLLMNPSRIDDITLISADMFEDATLGKIFSIYANSNGKEVNQLTISAQLKCDYMTEQQAIELLGNLVRERDVSISDASCEEIIYNNYKARKVNELLNNSRITAENVDDFLATVKDTADYFNKQSDNDINTLSELTELSGNYFNDNHKVKFQIGMSKLDEAIGGIDDGDITIISARPSVGKSAFALQIGRKFGKEGHKVGYFNLEMGKKQVYERAIASASGIDMTRIRRAINFLNDEKAKFDNGNSQLQGEKNFYVITGTQTISKIRAIQKKYNFDIIIIDYLQIITSTGNRGGNRASEVGDISRGLKAIATDFNIPVIALSQLNRSSERLKDKEPCLADLRESGDIEQDASVVLMMWNSNDEDLTEKTIKVEKSRNGFNEKIKLYFDGKHMKFVDETQDSGFKDIDESEDIPWD